MLEVQPDMTRAAQAWNSVIRVAHWVKSCSVDGFMPSASRRKVDQHKLLETSYLDLKKKCGEIQFKTTCENYGILFSSVAAIGGLEVLIAASSLMVMGWGLFWISVGIAALYHTVVARQLDGKALDKAKDEYEQAAAALRAYLAPGGENTPHAGNAASAVPTPPAPSAETAAQNPAPPAHPAPPAPREPPAPPVPLNYEFFADAQAKQTDLPPVGWMMFTEPAPPRPSRLSVWGKRCSEAFELIAGG